MNPPFTRNDIRNLQYSQADRRSLQRLEIKIANFLSDRDPAAFRAIDQTSVRTFFSPLGDPFLRKAKGTFASIVPTTALTSASGTQERKFLSERFQIETIVTSHDPARMNFSENTSIHESLLIARRPGEERYPTRFVSLARMPSDTHEAILLSDLINRNESIEEWGTQHSWPWPRIREGDWSAVEDENRSLRSSSFVVHKKHRAARLLDLVSEPYGDPYEKRAVSTRVKASRTMLRTLETCPQAGDRPLRTGGNGPARGS